MHDNQSDFLKTIPTSVRKRIARLAEEVDDPDRLLQEARKLILYDAVYTDVDAKYDLNQAMLSRAIRGCVDHGGRVPEGVDRAALLRQCPHILDAIEAAYNVHVYSQILGFV